MKTVLIYDLCGEELIKFAVVDGDWSKFNDVYINTAHSKLAEELCELIYPSSDPDGKIAIKLVDTFPHEAVIDGAKVIVCGFLP